VPRPPHKIKTGTSDKSAILVLSPLERFAKPRPTGNVVIPANTCPCEIERAGIQCYQVLSGFRLKSPE